MTLHNEILSISSSAFSTLIRWPTKLYLFPERAVVHLELTWVIMSHLHVFLHVAWRTMFDGCMYVYLYIYVCIHAHLYIYLRSWLIRTCWIYLFIYLLSHIRLNMHINMNFNTIKNNRYWVMYRWPNYESKTKRVTLNTFSFFFTVVIQHWGFLNKKNTIHFCPREF